MIMNNLINNIFDWCVRFLVWLAGIFGLTYKAVNVIIFCFLWPLFTLLLVWYILKLKRELNAYRRPNGYQ